VKEKAEQRTQLAATLESAGYTASIEPTIAFGGETLRALLAAQEGASAPIGPNGIGQLVTRDFGAR
jgi:hypothetical protein